MEKSLQSNFDNEVHLKEIDLESIVVLKNKFIDLRLNFCSERIIKFIKQLKDSNLEKNEIQIINVIISTKLDF